MDEGRGSVGFCLVPSVFTSFCDNAGSGPSPRCGSVFLVFGFTGGEDIGAVAGPARVFFFG
jgi:hypothetical protein